MAFSLPPLPYGYGSLAPFISASALRLHYDAHHRTYLAGLNALVRGTSLEAASLPELLRRAPRPSALFDNAAGAWNHAFFWNSLRPPVPGGAPLGPLRERIEADFGGLGAFKAAFKAEAARPFGSGWLWLVKHPDERLGFLATGNAHTPMAIGLVPVLALDLWEHAYYLDYAARRHAYAEAVVEHLINWEFAELNFEGELLLHG